MPAPRPVGRPARALGGAALLAALIGCGGGGVAPPDVLLPDGRTRGSVDFAIDADVLAATVLVIDRTFDAADCAVVEGTISAPGLHRLLIFDTRIVNLGELDLHVGDPANPLPPLDPADFEYQDCHGHRHLHGYAAYELRRPDGSLAVAGQKQGFCLLDSERALPGAADGRYTCADQGLTSGWADVYARTLDGQWVDVSGLPEGDYLLAVTINAEGNLPEVVDHHPNTAVVPVHLPAPGTPVPSPDDHGDEPASATRLAFPIGIVASISPAADADWFRVDLTVGLTYTFRTELLTLGDTRLRLTTPTGASTLASNDDVAPGSDLSSRIVWTATYTGPVAVEVTGASGAVGTYRLVVD